MKQIAIYPNLLENELHTNGSFVLKSSMLGEYLDTDHLRSILIELITMIQSDTYDEHKIIVINTLTDYFKLIAHNFLRTIFYKDIQNHQKLLLVIIFLSMKMSKLSSDSIAFLIRSVNYVQELHTFKNELHPFIESSDLRGCYFYFSNLFLGIQFYDSTINTIDYEYAPPKVNSEWVQKYKKENYPIEFWFYDSLSGSGLFIVFYTPKCRYSQCAFCNLPTLSSNENISSQQNLYKQIDSTLHDSISPNEAFSIYEVILSNNGNLFDIKTMPTLSLLYIVDNTINKLPNVKKIILESRVEYLNEDSLKTLKETVNLHTRKVDLEIAIGFEIFNEEYRNGYYKKGLSFEKVERSVELLAKNDISIKFYLMFHSLPNSSVEDSILDIQNSEDYFLSLSKKYKANINIHISPTYLATGTQLEKDYKKGIYVPPSVSDIERMYNELKVHKNLSYFISLNDEGLSAYTINNENYDNYLRLKHKINRFNMSNKR